MYESKRMGKYWTRYQPLLNRVRTAWPERDAEIDASDVIEALAVLHGLGQTVHESDQHRERVIALYRAWFREEVNGLGAMEGRTVLRRLVDELLLDEPAPTIQMIYRELVTFDTAYLHELALHLKASALNDSALQATG